MLYSPDSEALLGVCPSSVSYPCSDLDASSSSDQHLDARAHAAADLQPQPPSVPYGWQEEA